MKRNYDVVIIGSGPGGLAAAIAAKENGAEDVLIIERDVELGGILLQCIHNGFGLELFKEDLPGPAYAQHFIEKVRGHGVETLMDTMVLDITPERTIYAINRGLGYIEIEAGAIVLAMGCRERTRAQILLPGSRPAGVYTAGTAQRFVNVEGHMPGEKFVILGSGDIGMIMARRLTIEGARVERVLEIMPYLSGLTRNYVQCLLDYGIVLEKQRTVNRIIGNNRVEAIEAVSVDADWQPIPGTQEIIPCDTLLLSVGLIPENELSKQAGVLLDPVTNGPFVDDRFMTNVPGIFAAGNVVHVYDLVDWVTEAGYVAGKGAAAFARSERVEPGEHIPLKAGENIRYVVPHKLDKAHLAEELVRLQMRAIVPIEARVLVTVEDQNGEVVAKKAEPYARPGEILTLALKPQAYEAVQKATSLTINVRKR
ncbi:MAG TPA: NAD(P)/FAD-dependent oxidoreductase [Brevefilum fermentans]|jgi:NADPH-dependent 2,4-dienoyl-CoA reductase/sulfur reductase-like enzyme|uniref:Putative oxidoreductase n=1 Tax=Candidatus Brevifilum fermentans TaxID=1986204 RepID=A0A1Y6K174_9CHLR|nr:NAD(P)/FAD-dependent oxidoreductase [Brevefilum fermentans]MDI9566225.1 NAD(P)/FAD-dependent oxidoreductase [Chloroflexota bacterium]OQB87966.1 MAG: Glutamate synthase (NADPH) small chain [Chloroflexi bacterium ADurb.Bin120]SMX53403.1 putative oxidoreductase [Brevefilum fermentans]HOM67935.1 NAD(P)/FAD-dependent oxidoreductase [Brevefilum fermentans]HPX95526.1 NAD(P)/FAD-dependent oxidoreductase [Brevefilum fermentans]